MTKEKQKPETPNYDRLLELLRSKQAIAAKLLEALEVDRYLITLTVLKKNSPTAQNDLKHFWWKQDFHRKDVAKSLRHICADHNAKEDPTAEIDADDWV